jgi:S1-C subfamily serine protease
MAEISLRIEEPGRGTRELKFTKPVITIGRSSGCDVRVAGDEVSSRHARLRIYSDRAIIEDMNSTNGLLVNGVRISGSAEIGLDTVVQLGAGGPTISVVRGLPAIDKAQPAGAADTGQGSLHAPSHTKYYLLAAGVLLFFMFVGGTLLLGGVGLYWWKVNPGGVITSLDDENRLAEAVALVIVGWELQVRDPPPILHAGSGTGFAVGEEGYLLTNNHVVNEAELKLIDELRSKGIKAQWKVWAAFHGQVYDAKIVYKSRNQDMSVLKVERRLPYVFRLSKQEDIARRSAICVLGFPGAAMDMTLSASEDAEELLKAKNVHLSTDIKTYFKPRDFEYILQQGVVSRVTKDKNGARWVEYDAATGPGNSGGPLCREDGTVLGVHSRGNRERVGYSFSFLLGQYEEELTTVIGGLKWIR